VSHPVPVFQRRILIVEDDRFVASLLAGALSNEGLATAVAHNATAAKHELDLFDPDLVLVDLDLGAGPTGLDFVMMVARARPDVAAILLSKHPDEVSAGIRVGSLPEHVAYLRKTLVHDTSGLVEAIDDVLRGSPTRWRQDRAAKGVLDELTQAQRATLHLLAEGLSNAEIARRRRVSVSNVEQRVGEVFKALHLSGNPAVVPRVEAARQYIAAAGLTPSSS